MADQGQTCTPGDYTVVRANGAYVIRRALQDESWSPVATVQTEEQAVRIARELAADHDTRAWHHDGGTIFVLIE